MKWILSLSLLAVVCANGQKIKKNEIDKFEKFRRIETDYVTLNNGLKLTKSYVEIKLRSAGDRIFVLMRCDLGVVGKGDKFILMLDDSSQVVLSSTEVQGGYRSGSYQYDISLSDIARLSEHYITDYRYYSVNGYSDNTAQKQYRPYLIKLFKVFYEEFNKHTSENENSSS